MQTLSVTYRYSVYGTFKATLREGKNAFELGESLPEKLIDDDGEWILWQVI